MNETENTQHLDRLKRMIAENEQMRKELKLAIQEIELRLQQKEVIPSESSQPSAK